MQTQKPKSSPLHRLLEEVEIRGVHGNNQNRKKKDRDMVAYFCLLIKRFIAGSGN